MIHLLFTFNQLTLSAGSSPVTTAWLTVDSNLTPSLLQSTHGNLPSALLAVAQAPGGRLPCTCYYLVLTL
jgi:hypothetical protein